MKDSTRSTILRWFLLGFAIRAAFAVVLSLIAVGNFEALFLYFADLPTMLFLALAEASLPGSWFRFLVGSDPFYLSMNLIGCLLWGGIFVLISPTRNIVIGSKRTTTS
jgi:hypothetical protein